MNIKKLRSESLTTSEVGKNVVARINLKDLKSKIENLFKCFIEPPKGIKSTEKEEFDRIEIKLERKGNTLIYWEEGKFPIGMIEEYEEALRKTEKLLNKTGMNIEIWSSFKKIEGVSVLLGKAREDENITQIQ